MVRLLIYCAEIAGIFAGIAAGAWAVNKADKELGKVIDRQLDREDLIKKEEKEED